MSNNIFISFFNFITGKSSYSSKKKVYLSKNSVALAKQRVFEEEKFSIYLLKEEIYDLGSASYKAYLHNYNVIGDFRLSDWALKQHHELLKEYQNLASGESLLLSITKQDAQRFSNVVKFYMSNFENEISEDSWHMFHVSLRKMGISIAGI